MADNKTRAPRGGHGPNAHGYQRPKDMKGTFQKLMGYVGKYKASLVLVAVCLIVSSAASVASSYLLKPLLNNYILPGDFPGLLKMLVVLGGLFALSAGCSYAYARIMVHVAQRTVAAIRQDLFDRLQELPIRYYDQHQSGDLMSRFTNDIDTVSEMLNSSFASIISNVLTFVGTVAMMIVLNPWLTLITFGFLALMGGVVKVIGGRSRVNFQRQQAALGALNGYIEEMIEGQKVIKVFNHEGRAVERFTGLNGDYRDAATAAQAYAGMMMPAMGNLSRIDYAVTCCVGGLLAIGGVFDVGSLGAYLLYVKQVSQPVGQISQQINTLLEEHPDTASYISESQNVWGKIFNTHEVNILLGLVDYLGLDWDYVLILLSYCRRLSERRGSTKSLHYVETVAFGFYDEGICDAVSLQDKLRQMELMAETEGQLRSLFGMGSRALSTTEKRYFSTWLYDYGYGMDIIRRAYEITVDAIGEPKVKYTNSILSSWNSKGLKTLDAVNAFVEASDRERGKGKGETARRVGSTFETDSFFAAALRRNFGDEEADPGKATPSPDANS